MKHRIFVRILLTFFVLPLLLGIPSARAAGEEVTYGFVQDSVDPLLISAVFYPNFTSTDVSIAGGSFNLLLPEGTVTNPVVPPAPATGSFTNTVGSWDVKLITPSLYNQASGNPESDLEGNDVYQAIIPSPVTGLAVVTGVAVEIFKFRLPSDCVSGSVAVMVNGSSVEQSMSIFGDFSNNLSVGVDGGSAANIYNGNDASATLSCPLPTGAPAPDADNDGLADAVDPDDNNIDTDGDGIPDGADVDVDGDGTNDNGTDADGDGINDVADVDVDGDGTNDNGTDSDGDGINDANDTIDNSQDADNDGLADDVDPDDSNIDTDGDGIPDGADVDVDGDGTNDNGTDADGDGINDVSDVDVDGDGTNDNGTDSDGDGINDANDTIDNSQGIDSDGDGVLDADENAGPNNGDANGDGTPDKDQRNVASTLDTFGLSYVTAEVTGSCTDIASIGHTIEANLSVTDPEAEYPYGLIDITLSCSDNSGQTATLTVYWHGANDLSSFTYRKFGPQTPGGAIDTYYDFPYTFGQATIGGKTVATSAITLQDGAMGDDTGAEGMIIDPSGPALSLKKSSIGDYVWLDTNRDGIKDVGEAGIDGVLVELYELDLSGGVTSTIFITSMLTGPETVEIDSDDTVLGESGAYDFAVEGVKVYQVVISDTNFLPGGPLEHHIYTGDVTVTGAAEVYNGAMPRVVVLPTELEDHNHADFGYWMAPIEVTKTSSGIADHLDGTYSVRYQIQVNNLGIAATSYSLTDTFAFGADINVLSIITVTNDAGVTTNAGFDGQTNTGLASNVAILGNTIHTYEVEVEVAYTGVGDAMTMLSSCDATNPQPGSGLFNEVTVGAEGGASDQAGACPPLIPLEGELKIDKQSTSLFNLGSNRYEVTYRILVENVGSAPESYDLTDTPDIDDDFTIESALLSVNGGGLQSVTMTDGAPTTLATAKSLAHGETDIYLLRMIVDASGAADPAAEVAACDPTGPTAGTGLFNSATLDVNGTMTAGDVCPPAGTSQLLIQKQSVTPAITGASAYTVDYQITVVNDGTVTETYRLTDTFNFSGDFTVSGSVVVTGPVGVSLTPGFDGSTNAELATNVDIGGGATHVYELTVNVNYTGGGVGAVEIATCDPTVPTAGTGLFNSAGLSANGTTQSHENCPIQPQEGAAIVSKSGTVVEESTADLYTATYNVTVANTGAITTNYTLTDTFNFGADFAIQGGSLNVEAPAGVALAGGFDGVANPTIVTDVALAGNATHVYTITVSAQYTGLGDSNDILAQCDPSNPVAGEGLFNQVQMIVGTTLQIGTETCASASGLELLKVLNGVEPFGTGEVISFTITITNTGNLTVTTIPLEDQYNPLFIDYDSASVDPDGVTATGILTWTNLAPSGGLAPGGVVSVDVYFDALSDTGSLNALLPCIEDGEAPNFARIINATAEGDVTLRREESCASVQIEGRTAVNVSAFGVEQTDKGVVVEWTTITEADMLGFRLYRVDGLDVVEVDAVEADVAAASAAGAARGLIPAKNAGGSGGTTYRLLHTGAELGTDVSYVLEVVKADNSVERTVIDELNDDNREGPLYLPFTVW